MLSLDRNIYNYLILSIFMETEWIPVIGEWKKEKLDYIQDKIEPFPSCLLIKDRFENDSYQFEGEITILARGNLDASYFATPAKNYIHGEAKILFNKANEELPGGVKGENYRIDLINQESRGKCRLVISGVPFIEIPLDIKETVPMNFKLILKTVRLIDSKETFISFYINKYKILDKILIYDDFDGYVGVGTYNSRVKFSNLKLTELPNKNCFVIMQYDKKRYYLFEKVISQVIKDIEKTTNIKFDEPIILKESYETGILNEQLEKQMKEADIVIVDISEQNLNVFFELGYEMALKKIIIKLKDSDSTFEPPSDLKAHRYFEYTLPIEESKLNQEINNLRTKLKKILLNELKNKSI